MNQQRSFVCVSSLLLPKEARGSWRRKQLYSEVLLPSPASSEARSWQQLVCCTREASTNCTACWEHWRLSGEVPEDFISQQPQSCSFKAGGFLTQAQYVFQRLFFFLKNLRNFFTEAHSTGQMAVKGKCCSPSSTEAPWATQGLHLTHERLSGYKASAQVSWLN